MRIAIISDIHSNLEALEKTLEIIKQKSIDEIVCLGDIVGYGANPNECLSLVKETTSHILLGNHDEAAISLKQIEDFNPYARNAVLWTTNQLTEANKEFLRSLPYKLELNGLLFTHASPFEPEEWHYILSLAEAENNFNFFQQPICFVGHSHAPVIFSEDFWAREVVRDKRFIVNVGSVGQPRDLNWRLSFGIFETGQWTYENIRSEYDVQTASDKIRNAGLPRQLAERILIGR
ncbi:MAG: metallophosphoesterase family protein [Bacteroidota bacterium]|nr:metallophosphoesterase family protein [Bacteroidota bacterium]